MSERTDAEIVQLYQRIEATARLRGMIVTIKCDRFCVSSLNTPKISAPLASVVELVAFIEGADYADNLRQRDVGGPKPCARTKCTKRR